MKLHHSTKSLAKLTARMGIVVLVVISGLCGFFTAPSAIFADPLFGSSGRTDLTVPTLEAGDAALLSDEEECECCCECDCSSGSLWTTLNQCDKPQSSVDYTVGGRIYLNGNLFPKDVSLAWKITGLSNSSDANVVVANGRLKVAANGGFCYPSYYILPGDIGEYQVEVCGKVTKYRVVEATPTSTPKPTATNTPIPTPTNTPKPPAPSVSQPTATSTPAPTATNTPQPTASVTPTVVPAPVGSNDNGDDGTGLVAQSQPQGTINEVLSGPLPGDAPSPSPDNSLKIPFIEILSGKLPITGDIPLGFLLLGGIVLVGLGATTRRYLR